MTKNERNNANRNFDEMAVPVRFAKPSERGAIQMINDAIQVPEWICPCGARVGRRCAQVRCGKCRSRERWHRHQEGARRHQRGDQW